MSPCCGQRFRRAAAGVAAGALVLSGAAVAAGAGTANAVQGFAFERLQGTDRYGTAAAIARDAFATASTVVLASGAPRNFPDALTGGYLAGEVSAPILLTAPGSLPRATQEALSALRTTRVVVIGGETAVSADVERALRVAGYAVERLGGADRYATAELVARRVGADAANIGTVGGLRTAILGNGQNFPDILAAGPLSVSEQLPLTLTRPTELPASTRAVLRDLAIRRVLVVGGTTAVSADVERELADDLGIAVTRLQGADRFGTAVAIAEYAYDTLGYDRTRVNLARSDEFADALAGGPHGGATGSPTVLTPPTSLDRTTEAFLARHSTTLARGHLFGGITAVSPDVEAAAERAAQGDTTAPTLVASTTAPAAGDTTVVFVADEPLRAASVTTGDLVVTGGTTQAGITGVAVTDRTITVTTSPLVSGNVVTLKARSVTDLAGNAGPPADVSTPAAVGGTTGPTLSALWHMEDTGRTMVDDSGRGQHGTSTESVELRQPGSTGYGYRFTVRPSYVSVPSSSLLNPDDEDFTITAHVRIASLPPGGDVNTYEVVRKGLSSTPGGDWKLEIRETGVAHCLFRGSAGQGDVYGTANLADDRWHSLTCSRTATGVALVVDGVARSTSKRTGTIRQDEAVILGAKSPAGDDQLDGYLDEVSISKG